MGELVYILCALSSSLCTILLYRHYARTRLKLLFWSATAFLCFTLTNIVLFIDLVLVPTIDFTLWRSILTLVGVVVLLYGLIHHHN